MTPSLLYILGIELRSSSLHSKHTLDCAISLALVGEIAICSSFPTTGFLSNSDNMANEWEYLYLTSDVAGTKPKVVRRDKGHHHILQKESIS